MGKGKRKRSLKTNGQPMVNHQFWDPCPFSEELREFIDSVEWTYAKTMPEWPHEYIVRKRVDEEMFVALVKHIRRHGYWGRFYKSRIQYFDDEERGMVYWTMGAAIARTIIINRCESTQTFEYRLRHGTLPVADKGGDGE